MNDLIEEYENCLKNNNNSYKFVLGLSLIRLNPKTNKVIFDDIADVVIDLYFNNVFIYGLREWKSDSQIPILIQDMQRYFNERGFIPKKLEGIDKSNLIKIATNTKNKGFFKYVLPCWQGAQKNEKGAYIYPSKGQNEFFSYDLDEKEVILNDEFLFIINKYNRVLEELTLFNWVKFLEKKNKDIANILSKIS